MELHNAYVVSLIALHGSLARVPQPQPQERWQQSFTCIPAVVSGTGSTAQALPPVRWPVAECPKGGSQAAGSSGNLIAGELGWS